MTEIYAGCVSFSQGRQGTTVRASLIHSEDGQTRQLTVEWPNLGDINANGDAAEWLYSALSRLVTNYDEHTLVKASVKPTELLLEATDRAA